MPIYYDQYGRPIDYQRYYQNIRDQFRDPPPPPGEPPPDPVPDDQVSTVTGIDPNEVAAATYGKLIPIWVGGTLRLGCHIIYGPTFSADLTTTSFGVSFGMPANNIGNHEIRELRLDGFKVWTKAGGASYAGLIFRFYPGTETQGADPLVSAANPAAPVAHRGQCCVFIEDLKVADFDYKVPFVSALIADISDPAADPDDGVNLGDALQQIAVSPYVNLITFTTPATPPKLEFETLGISERVDAVIVADKYSFLEMLNRYARLYLWDVIQTDKLKVQERGSVAPDLALNLQVIIGSSGEESPIVIHRAQQPDVPRNLEYSFIDIDRDYEINTVVIKRPREPVPVTAGAGIDSIALPSVHTITEARAWATLRKYKDEVSREVINFSASAYGYELEPGDVVSVDCGFKTYIVRVLESSKGANWTNQIKAEPVLRCAMPIAAGGPLDGIDCLTGAWSMGRQLLSTYIGLYWSEAFTGVGVFDGTNPTECWSFSRALLSTYDGQTLYDASGSNITQLWGQVHENDTAWTFTPVGGGQPTTTTVNGRAAADFNGTNNYLVNGSAWSSYATTTAYYFVMSLEIDVVNTNDTAQIFKNDPLICDNNGNIGFFLRTLSGSNYGIAYNFDNAPKSVERLLNVAVPIVVSLRHESGVLYGRINNGTEFSVSSGATAANLDVCQVLFGSGVGGSTAFFDGKLLEMAAWKVPPSAAIRNKVEQAFMAWSGAAGQAGSAPLDQMTGYTAAYSMSRKLRNLYTGAFYSATGSTVDTLHDQSGNARDLTKSGTPVVGTVGTVNRVCVDIPVNSYLTSGAGDPLSDFITAANGYFIVSGIFDVVTTGTSAIDGNPMVMDSAGNVGITGAFTDNAFAYNSGGPANSASQQVIVGAPTVIEWKHTGGVLSVRVDGGQETLVVSGNTASLAGLLRLGGNRTASSAKFDGKIFEAIFFSTVPSQAQCDALLQDMTNWMFGTP